MVDAEQEKRDDRAEDPAGMAHQFLARLGQSERALVMPAEFHRDHHVMQQHERHEIRLVQNPVDGKEVGLGVAGPVELGRGPVHEESRKCRAASRSP